MNEMQRKVFETASSHGWWDMKIIGGDEDNGPEYGPDVEKVNVPEKLMLMVSEISEALEHYREGNNNMPLNVIWYKEGDRKPDGFAVELADCIIRILDFAEAFNIDMEEVLRIKMEYNETRPYRHGNKKC